MASARAPRGGIIIAGRHYRGGKFIPSSVLDKATPDQRKKLERKPPRQVDISGLIKKLAGHKNELNPKQADFLRRVHEGLSSKFGNGAPHAVGAQAESLLKAHGGAKHPDHKAALAHHLGSAHAMLGMGKSGDGKKSASDAAPGSPVETSTKQDGATITVKQSADVFTASNGELSAHAPTAEEAVGKLVMENADEFGITIDGGQE
jgi:hypothetical protein